MIPTRPAITISATTPAVTPAAMKAIWLPVVALGLLESFMVEVSVGGSVLVVGSVCGRGC